MKSTQLIHFIGSYHSFFCAYKSPGRLGMTMIYDGDPDEPTSTMGIVQTLEKPQNPDGYTNATTTASWVPRCPATYYLP